MATVVFEHGLGIMPGERVEVEQEYLDRLREKHRAQEADEVDVFRLIELGAQLEANKPSAELQRVYDEIEAIFVPHLREEATAVNSESRIKPADKQIIEQFRDYCKRFSPPLPPLPAHPAAVAAFLTSELNRGASHFRKRLNAISRIHRSLGLPDPGSDVLILALVRKFTQTKKEVD